MKLKIFKNNNRCNDLTVLSIDSLFDVTSSRRIHASQYKIEGIPFFRGTEINNIKKGIYDYHVFISNEFYDEIKEKYPIPKVGDILITAVGTVGNTLLIEKDFDFYFKDGNIIWLKKKEHKNFNSKYINYFFNTIHGKEKIFGLTGGSAYQALTIKSLSKSNIFLPTISMQNKIVEILEKQEYIISNIEKLISKTEKMFDYLKNELLYRTTIIDFKNGNINLVKYSDRSNIRKVKFNDIISFSMGNTPKKVDDNYNGDIPWITISNLKCKYITDYTAFIKNSKNIKIIPKDTLIGSFKMSVGRFGFTTEDCCTNEAIIAIKKEDTKENLDYLYYLLPKYFNDNAEKNGQGIPLLNSKKIKDIILDIPPLEEQNKIVNFLKKYENLIENQKKLLEKEKQKFEWLSEKLLSGEYLVVDEE